MECDIWLPRDDSASDFRRDIAALLEHYAAGGDACEFLKSLPAYHPDVARGGSKGILERFRYNVRQAQFVPPVGLDAALEQAARSTHASLKNSLRDYASVLLPSYVC